MSTGGGDLVLDTSVLLDLTSDTNTRAAFVSLIRASDFRVLLPSPALDESFVTDDPDTLLQTAEGLADLMAQLGERLAVAALHTDTWCEEFKHPLHSTPILPDEDRVNLFDALGAARVKRGETLEWFLGVRSRIKGWKSGRWADDRAARANTQQFMTKNVAALKDLRPFLKGFTLRSLPDWILDPLLVAHCGASAGSSASVMSRDQRCPSLKTWAALAYLTMLGDSLPVGFAGDDPLFDMLARDKNNFYDAALASTAAYAEYFVTKDNRLLRRCNFLKNRSCVSFSAVTLKGLHERLGRA